MLLPSPCSSRYAALFLVARKSDFPIVCLRLLWRKNSKVNLRIASVVCSSLVSVLDVLMDWREGEDSNPAAVLTLLLSRHCSLQLELHSIRMHP